MTATHSPPQGRIETPARVTVPAPRAPLELCGYCDDVDRPITGTADSVEHEETGTRIHLGCWFTGGYDGEREPVDPDALYDRIGDR
jgi:hypothetical protein